MKPVVVGVDVGSGSARAVALDSDGAVAGDAVARYPGNEMWPPGRADPQGWRRGVAAGLEMLRAHVPASGEAAAVCIGGQSPTSVPSETGLAVTYRHPAGATEGPVEAHLAQLDLLRSEHGDSVEGMQIWDWLVAQLGGPHRQSRWYGDPFIPGYGEPIHTGELVGITDGSDGVTPGTPLVAGAQDAYLAFWAAGTDVPGRALDPGGRTGGLGVAVLQEQLPEVMFSLRSAAPGVAVVGGPVNGHGLMLEWLSAITGCSIDALLREAEDAPPGSGGVVVLPYLEGERAPRWCRALRAQFTGIGSGTGRAELARATLEASAFGLAHIAEELARSGVVLDRLVCGGSPARSRLWCSIKASVLQVPVEMPMYSQLAAYGAALAAGAGVDWWPKPGEGVSGSWPRPPVELIQPESAPPYRAGYRRFVELGDQAMANLIGP